MMERIYLNMLIANAQADNDTETYANLALDTVGEDAAIQFVNTPNWFELLCQKEPRATQFRPWFDRLRGDILELTQPEPESTQTGTPQTP